MPFTRLVIAILCGAASATFHIRSTASAAEPHTRSALVERFLAHEDPIPLTGYRATRRMHAANVRFKKQARVEARTSFDPIAGFKYEVVTQEGSSLVRDRALLPILEAEARVWADGTAHRSALTESNYEFGEGGEPGWLRIRPRRDDRLLVDGAILVEPVSGDLLRIEGRLAKNPSFWTRRVDVVREYQRIQGVRVPTRVVSRASLRLFGVSEFEMTYEYEEINGEPVAGAASAARP